MKKLLTIMLALIFCLSATTIFTACENEPVKEQPQEQAHTHTYAPEWTCDDDYHYHKATCEHTEEIADKAEHTYGNDGNCTVCQMKKPPVATVTEEQWAYELDLETNKTNKKATYEEIADSETQKIIYKTDGENYHSIAEANNSSRNNYEENIYIKKETNYDRYEREEKNGEFTKTTIASYRDASGFGAMFKLGTYLKDKFSDAEYDKTTKSYIINYENLTLESLEFSNAKYIITFKDGILQNIKLTSVEGTYTLIFYFEFDVVSIVAPQV